MKAFYLPWMLEGERIEAEVRAIAKTAIEELQYRAFQIKQRFLEKNGVGTELSYSFDLNLSNPQGAFTEETIARTLAQIRQEVDVNQPG